MTRDEAVKIVTDRQTKSIPLTLGPVEALHLLKDVEDFVDVLAALGVLNLEDDKPRCHFCMALNGYAHSPGCPAREPPPARCEPPSEYRDEAFHWLSTSNGLIVREWRPGLRVNADEWLDSSGERYAPEDYASLGWRYVAPCLPPVTMHMDASGAAVVEHPEGRL